MLNFLSDTKNDSRHLKRSHKRGFSMFTVFACILFAIGGFHIYQYRKTLQSHIKVNARLVRIRHTPPMNGHYSMDYPVFSFTVNEQSYTVEYAYAATNQSKLNAIVQNPELPDGAFKTFLQRLVNQQPEFIIGETYTLLVNPQNPHEFYIETQNILYQELKWFIMGFAILCIQFFLRIFF